MFEKVKLKDNLVQGRLYGNLYYTSQMRQFEGKELTIVGGTAGGNWLVEESEFHFSSEMLERVKTPCQKNVEALIQQQIDKGSKHYGKTLEDWDAGIVERLRNMQEEMIDAVMHCEHVIAKLKEMGLC